MSQAPEQRYHNSPGYGSGDGEPVRTGDFGVQSMVLRSPRDYFLMFRERWHWGLLVAIILINVLVFLELRKTETFYTEATLEIQTAEENVLPSERLFAESNDAELLMNKHVARLSSRKFFSYLMPFFTEEELQQVGELYVNPDKPNKKPNPAQIIRSGMEVQIRADDTLLIQVGMMHRDPDLAPMLADRIAEKYIDYHNDLMSRDLREAVLDLRASKRQKEQELEDNRKRIQDFREQNAMVDNLGEFSSVITERVKDLSARVIEADAEILNATNVLAEIALYREASRDLTQLEAIASHPSVAPNVTLLEELQTERRQLEQRYFERHPRMKENTERIGAIEALIEDNIDEVAKTLEVNQRLMTDRVARLRTELAEAERELLKLENLDSELASLQIDAVNTEAALARLTERLEDANVEANLRPRHLTIHDYAWPPQDPEQPNLEKQAIWAVMAGFLSLVLVPVGLGLLDTRLKTQWEIEEFLGTQLLGEIPRFDNVNRKKRPHLAAGNNQPTLCEAFRGLYGRMELCTRVDYPKIVLVASTVPSEGKSLVASNLAYTFARHGRRVLLTDVDFRGPSQHLYHGLDNSTGILPWLKEGKDASPDVVQEATLGIHEVTENLHFLPSGGVDKQPTEFFSNPRLKGLFDQLRKDYDLIVLDTPPVGVFPDTLLLKPFVDEVIYVCRFRKVNKFRVRHFLEKIHEAGHNLEGVVLNGLPTGRMSAYYGYHGYGSNRESEYRSYYAKKS
ncbi:MAG: GumC family protein [Opitutales bacterium]